ncbi:hypothetical protein ATANTOWER_005530 [Ataeniobius toweri]|uniref:Uncharacterized protein n=1 Tax=Ataeniobius toweri TaxID=208326 RepID=A0ABU7A553_9TELE|nr:hypothetical protein [Ataeniobius toweri]
MLIKCKTIELFFFGKIEKCSKVEKCFPQHVMFSFTYYLMFCFVVAFLKTHLKHFTLSTSKTFKHLVVSFHISRKIKKLKSKHFSMGQQNTETHCFSLIILVKSACTVLHDWHSYSINLKKKL